MFKWGLSDCLPENMTNDQKELLFFHFSCISFFSCISSPLFGFYLALDLISSILIRFEFKDAATWNYHGILIEYLCPQIFRLGRRKLGIYPKIRKNTKNNNNWNRLKNLESQLYGQRSNRPVHRFGTVSTSRLKNGNNIIFYRAKF